MTETITPINVANDAWIDLVDRVNEIIDKFANNVVSTSAATTGNINIIGNFYANTVFSGGQRAVTVDRQIVAGAGLAGGGTLANTVTITIDANTAASLAKADSALQTADFANTVGLKNKIDITDINTSGTANSATYLRGDGAWSATGSGIEEAPLVGGPFGRQTGDWVEVATPSDLTGLMSASIYDPGNVANNVYNRANHTGFMPLSGLAQGANGIFVVGRTATSGNVDRITAAYTATANTVAIRSTSGILEVGTPTANSHATTKTYVDSTISSAVASKMDVTNPVITAGTLKEDVFTISDGSSVSINPDNGSVQLWTLGANRTPSANTAFDNGHAVTLMIDDGTARTITWTTMDVKWVGGEAPTLATSGYTVIELWKVSNQIYGAYVGDVE